MPGPAEEIRVVRRIYRDYIYLRKSERQISTDLNAESLTCFGRRWSRNLVRAILSNEKYVGNNIVGRFSQRLRTPQITNPPEKWIRCDGAFQPIVPREVFDAAARVRHFNEKTYLSPAEILKALTVVLDREGKLTTAIINRAPDLPSANTVGLRFGTLGQAYEKLGYQPPVRYGYHAVNRALRSVRQWTEQELLQMLLALGIAATRSERGLITVSSRCTIEVLACRFQQPRSYLAGWRLSYVRSLGASALLAVRMAPGNQAVQDVLLVPSRTLAQLPVFIRPEHDVLLAGYKHATLESAARVLSGAA